MKKAFIVFNMIILAVLATLGTLLYIGVTHPFMSIGFVILMINILIFGLFKLG